VVATTGMTSRELMLARDRGRNFYMAGSMGHAMGIGLGVALGQPERPVVVLDGDGAVLMHMGTLSSIGHLAPANLLHVVLDNEAYGSTGDQPTTSSSTDLAAVALACGYRRAWRCREPRELAGAVSAALGERGPALVVAKIDVRSREAAPRVTAGQGLASVAARFRASLDGQGD
jgi:phosphonopyruvate decarboxylase